MDKTCKNCKHFIRGSEIDYDKLSDINSRNLDVDRCSQTHYKVTENSFCIINKFKPIGYITIGIILLAIIFSFI